MPPVTDEEVKLRYTEVTGPGNTNASSAGASLGGYLSTTDISAGLHGIFDAVSPAEDAGTEDEYRCIGVYNSNTTNTLTDVYVWLTAEDAQAGIEIGLDLAGVLANTGVADTVANEDTAPSPAVTFSNVATSKGAGLGPFTLGPLQWHAIWVKRTTQNLGASATKNFTIRAEGQA